MFSTPELPGSDSVGMISAPSEGTPNSSNQAAKLEITSELRKFTPKSVQWKNTGGLKQKHKKTAFRQNVIYGGNGFGYVFILPNRPHADTNLICVVGVIDFYTD